MIFVDSGAIYAFLVKNDANHVRARQWVKLNQEELLTTDYVLDELLTLLRTRGEWHRSRSTSKKFRTGDLAKLHWVEQHDFNRAWELFDSFEDKDWSFTDCVSYAVMERLQIKKAFAFDEHFCQFGIVEVVP